MRRGIRILLFLCCFALSGYAESLKFLVENIKNNPLLNAKIYQKQSLHEEKKGLYALYLPKVEVGYAYQNTHNPDIFYPANVNGPFVEATWLLFDGLKREGKLKAQNDRIKSSEFAIQSTQQQLILQVIQKYFGALSLQSRKKAVLRQQEELQQSITKYETLYHSGLATQDTLEAIKAQYAQNSDQIENIELALETYKEQLNLLSGIEKPGLEEYTKIKEIDLQTKPKDRADLQAQFHYVKSLESVPMQHSYLPTIALSNRYMHYEYHDRNIPTLPFPFSIDNPKYQNIFGISISLTLFDTFATYRAKEAAHLQALAANFEYSYQKDSQRREQIIAKNALNTAKEKIKWADSALTSASIAYAYAKDKFNAQLIDYTQYLRALTTFFEAQSFYDESLFEYEIKKAEFLYNNGENLEEFL